MLVAVRVLLDTKSRRQAKSRTYFFGQTVPWSFLVTAANPL
jgi:hypothetical protein